jgi:ABC-type Fe3+ transport system permease subunit
MTTLFISFVFGVGAIVLAFMLARLKSQAKGSVEAELSRPVFALCHLCSAVGAAVIGIGKLI